MAHDFSGLGHLCKDPSLGEEKVDRQGMGGSFYLPS